MYSFGSVSAVGSWFCISVTSSVRKSFAEIVAESPESPDPLDPLVPVVPVVLDVPLSSGETMFIAALCAAVIA
jgi:hypothetical protein